MSEQEKSGIHIDVAAVDMSTITPDSPPDDFGESWHGTRNMAQNLWKSSFIKIQETFSEE